VNAMQRKDFETRADAHERPKTGTDPRR
jgi:hypothetical protein